MFRTPNTYGYFTATYTPIKPLTIALSGTYTGSMLVQRAAISAENAAMGEMPERPAVALMTPDFFDLGIKAAYDLSFVNRPYFSSMPVYKTFFRLIRKISIVEPTGIPTIFMVLPLPEVFLQG